MKSFHLPDVLRRENIFFDLPGTTSSELIRNIAAKLAECDEIRDADKMALAAIEREEELPTGIESGIALPHARTDAVRKLLCAFARPANPINFESPDGKPCDLVFFAAVPTDGVDDYLHLTASLIRKLHHTDVADQLRNANSADDILKVLGAKS
ncbi:PTS sugar transporter subunit IIA [bacterium]|nr:PTS sugar transporter subunit IIA [bacterium]